MRHWARSRHLGGYAALTASTTALAVYAGDATIPLPNLRVGPWNNVVLAYLLAAVPGFGWLAIARATRTPMEAVSVVSARVRLLDHLCALIPPALASSAAILVGGQTSTAIGRNLLIFTAASLVVLYLSGWLVATGALLTYLLACALAGFAPRQSEPVAWAFVLGTAQPFRAPLVVGAAVTLSWLLVPVAGRRVGGTRWPFSRLPGWFSRLRGRRRRARVGRRPDRHALVRSSRHRG